MYAFGRESLSGTVKLGLRFRARQRGKLLNQVGDYVNPDGWRWWQCRFLPAKEPSSGCFVAHDRVQHTRLFISRGQSLTNLFLVLFLNGALRVCSQDPRVFGIGASWESCEIIIPDIGLRTRLDFFQQKFPCPRIIFIVSPRGRLGLCSRSLDRHYYHAICGIQKH